MRERITLTCDGCGKTYQRYPSQLREGQVKHFCSTDCARVPPIARTCNWCGAGFTATRRQVTRGDGRYCSTQCARRAQGAARPDNRLTLKCEVCGQPFLVPASRLATARFCSRECQAVEKTRHAGPTHPRYEQVELTCQWCGSPFTAKRSRVAKGIARYCSRRCLGSAVSARPDRIVSSLEAAIEGALRLLDVPYVAQKNLGYWAVDFYVPDRNLVIECDGEYWHSRPGTIARDAEKDAWMVARGKRVVRLTEREIRADPIAAARRALEYAE